MLLHPKLPPYLPGSGPFDPAWPGRPVAPERVSGQLSATEGTPNQVEKAKSTWLWLCPSVLWPALLDGASLRPVGDSLRKS